MERQANPDEKRVYDRIVLQALRFLMQPDQAGKVAELAGNGDPAEAVATTVAVTIKQITAAAAQAGKKLPPTYIYPAAKEIMMHLIEMLVAFKIVPREQAKQMLAQAQAMFVEITSGGGQPQEQPQQAGGMLAQGA